MKNIKKKFINQLIGCEKNKDIYILASGSTMNFIDKSFFNNKTCIGLNRIFNNFECKYIIAKDYNSENFKNFDGTLILSEYFHGDNDNNILNLSENNNCFYFKHLAKFNNEPNFKALELSAEGFLVNSYSTMTSAIHLAIIMGARNIILCGHDCCQYLGKYHLDNYYNSNIKFDIKTDLDYFLFKANQHTSELIKLIKIKYNANIYGLIPDPNLSTAISKIKIPFKLFILLKFYVLKIINSFIILFLKR